jgi:hypothetical protein
MSARISSRAYSECGLTTGWAQAEETGSPAPITGTAGKSRAGAEFQATG